MIIGGGRIYAELLPQTERIYLTRVHAEIEGDTFFPELDMAEWETVDSESLPADAARPFALSFETLSRIA